VEHGQKANVGGQDFLSWWACLSISCKKG